MIALPLGPRRRDWSRGHIRNPSLAVWFGGDVETAMLHPDFGPIQRPEGFNTPRQEG